MYVRSENCPRNTACVQNGKGVAKMKELAAPEQMYHKVRLFKHITLDPGCSIGYHTHEHETEFYYMLRGEAVFSDNGTEVVLRAGDISATGYGEGHSLENRSQDPVEIIALIVTE